MTVKSAHFKVEDKKIKPCKPYVCKVLSNLWLRGLDSNQRPPGYERGLTGFCGFVKIRVFVGISVFTRVLICRTFVSF